MTLTTTALREQLELYLGWSYDLHDPRYPTQLPGVRLPAAPPRQTNCCAFVEGLVVGAAARAGEVPWSLAAHNRAMITDAAHRYSSVEVLVDVGLAERCSPMDSAPPAWSVCQGWRANGHGHTFLIADVHEGTRVLILEANCAYGLNGVGWRGHGMAQASSPPALWYRDSRAWDWDRVRATYPGLKVAALRIDRLAELVDAGDQLPDDAPEGGGSIRS